jgi:signal transduction histidine kinase
MVALAFGAVSGWTDIVENSGDLVLWGLLQLSVDLMPISYSAEISQTMSLPVVLAAGMVLPFNQVALVSFVACWDPREFTRRIGLARSLFNRSQIALSAGSASFVFHQLGGSPLRWPAVLWITVTCLAVEIFVNWLTVITAARLATRDPLRRITEDILLGSPIAFALSYGAFGLLALLFAATSESVGPWGLVAAVIPLALGREMFLYRKRSAVATARFVERDQLLQKVTEQVVEERRDERAHIAAALHDEVLPALFKVHLMGEVLRQDLDSGRLLSLEEDIPELRQAADRASRQIRILIRDLRRSSIGAGGLVSTLQLLVDELRSVTQATIHAQIEEVGGSPSLQLLIYQIAREALQNATAHSDATDIKITLIRDGSNIRLIVFDNGRGFSVRAVDRERHFGIQLMVERAELADGVLHIDSHPGEGTRVLARFPRDQEG